MQGTLAVITCFAANFVPKYWAACSGQFLAISQNQALFSLLGTTYGGDGITTFALPDLRGRSLVGTGPGPGLSNYFLGQGAGSETVTLTIANLPPHDHNGTANLYLQADPGPGTDTTAEFTWPAAYANAYAAAPTTNVTMQAPVYTGTIGNAGGNQPISILSPYLAINYVICLSGVFPSRN